MEGNDRPCPSPCPQPPPSSSSSLLKDISNFKTPKRPSQFLNFSAASPFPPPSSSSSSSSRFFTASKQTPRSAACSSFRSRPSLSGRTKTKATAASSTVRRLKAFELEQSQSSRKEQLKKEQALRSLSKSLTTWLNFLFQNPRSCGYRLTAADGDSGGKVVGAGLGKRRDSGGCTGVGVEPTWRSPKRMRDQAWRGGQCEDAEEGFSSSKRYAALRNSLKEVCSFDDLKQRMRAHLSLSSCKEIFDVMTHVSKTIDEGRLKMKPHCPMVTDVGMKEKATSILMSYNMVWLRVGLHIILGGDSLLPDRDVSADDEIDLLKMIIEKQFFSHAGLAKAYAYNRMVEGLYRPGYYEALGSIILKRFLLLVLVLDRTKSQSALSLKYGLDGVDGGSPLLFTVHSKIKSSRQLITDFLSSEVMHGEGNLLAHLVILGYKVSYQQSPLVEYDFRVKDLSADLKDGVRLCRAIQLLQNDPSILMKMVVPSDTRKKGLANCSVALRYLKDASVTLHDEDTMTITEDDIVSGDMELTISLLWSMFVHLQLPLLIDKTILVEEISKIRQVNSDLSSVINPCSSLLTLLLHWVQAVCEKYECKIESFSSLIDGKAIWCLLDYYFRKELCCSHCLEDPHESRGEESIMSAAEYTDAVHNFILSQKLTTILGNFPEVMQISDILEHSGAISDRSVIVLLVFLSSQLTVKKTIDQLNFHKLLGCSCQSPNRRNACSESCFVSPKAVLDREEVDGRAEDAARKFKAIKAWWQEMAERNSKFVGKSAISTLQYNSTSRDGMKMLRENAAVVIQSYFRRSIERRKFLKAMNAISFLQSVARAWLSVKQSPVLYRFKTIAVTEFTHGRGAECTKVGRYVKFIIDRHTFVKSRRSVLLIQQAARIWMTRRGQVGGNSNDGKSITPDLANAAIVLQKYFRGWRARSSYKATREEKASSIFPVNGFDTLEKEATVVVYHPWNKSISSWSPLNQHLASTRIQSHIRGWLLRRKFLNQKQAVMKVQNAFRCWRAVQELRITTKSIITIQSHVRGWIVRREAWRHKYLITVLQRCWRVWLIRRDFLSQRQAARKLQTAIRCVHCWKEFRSLKHAAIQIQRFLRGQIIRNRLLGASNFCRATVCYSNVQGSTSCLQNFELKIVVASVLKLQRWWRGVLFLRQRTISAITIQSHIRGWIGRQRASRERHLIVVIQSHWKGYLARKESRGQLLDLRLRVQRSAKNVDDSKRIINRLKKALAELLSMKNVSGILHTCATLDMTTEHSQKCCEELVGAGAIDTLLKLIRSVSQSIPDQEVLKHALSTLRNLARYPLPIEVLIESKGSVETILWVLLRNKEEGYFIASEVLKKICSTQRGVDAVLRSPALLKRLHCLVEEQKRKATIEKRNPRGAVARENTERRLREAAEVLKLIADR